ncbi:hypothetical protein U0070_021648, partial [Myodes glareolus]
MNEQPWQEKEQRNGLWPPCQLGSARSILLFERRALYASLEVDGPLTLTVREQIWSSSLENRQSGNTEGFPAVGLLVADEWAAILKDIGDGDGTPDCPITVLESTASRKVTAAMAKKKITKRSRINSFTASTDKSHRDKYMNPVFTHKLNKGIVAAAARCRARPMTKGD